MNETLILARGEESALGIALLLDSVGQERTGVSRHVAKNVHRGGAYLMREFEIILQQVEERATYPSGQIRLTVIVDAVRLSELSPLSREPWSALIAMLVLALPGVRWVFCVAPSMGDSAEERAGMGMEFIRWLHSPAQLWLPWTEPLFDSTGLRSWIAECTRSLALQSGATWRASYLRSRNDVAVVVEDEPDYAYYLAYVAYRFAFRTWVLPTAEVLRMFSSRFTGTSERTGVSSPWLSQPPDLVIQDLYLSFADAVGNEQDTGLSDPRQWAREYKILAGARRRPVTVTVGHRGSGLEKWKLSRSRRATLREQNRRAKRKMRAVRRRGPLVFKPLSGIFDARDRLGLDRHLGLLRDHEKGLPREAGEHEHSAPGRLLAIAVHLLRKADRLLPSVASVEEAVYGAVLSGQALELLGGRTPTSSLHALALQHQFEVLAESYSYGTEYTLALRHRFREIKRDISKIAAWHAPERRKRVELNAQLMIAEALASRFRERNQFDEEQACLREARSAYFSLLARRPPWGPLLRPVLGYLALTLRSLGWFATCLMTWLLIFGLTYHLLGGLTIKGRGEVSHFMPALMSATQFFFTQESAPWTQEIAETLGGAWSGVLAVQAAVALLHVGILVAHLFMILSRR